jgi:hypothetical protein
MDILQPEPVLTLEEVFSRRAAAQSAERVIFSVKALYGLSRQSVQLPLSESESIESGQICITLDPDSDVTCNVGVIDYARGMTTVRYGAQAVFPGLYKLVHEGNHDPSLLNPVRVVATDQCSLTPDLAGWHALGCLDFLPGSVWAGATGG